MARILVNDNSSAGRNLKDNLQTSGHQILYTDVHGENAVRKAEELKADLLLMNTHPENFKIESKNGIGTNIFNSNIPIIPVINLTKKEESKKVQSYYSPLKQVLANASHGYLLKHNSEEYDLDKLKFTIDMAIYKQTLINNNSTENKIENAD